MKKILNKLITLVVILLMVSPVLSLNNLITIPPVKADSPPIGDWANYYGTAGYDELSAACPTDDGGYLLVGYSDNFWGDENYDIFGVKINRKSRSDETIFNLHLFGFKYSSLISLANSPIVSP